MTQIDTIDRSAHPGKSQKLAMLSSNVYQCSKFRKHALKRQTPPRSKRHASVLVLHWIRVRSNSTYEKTQSIMPTICIANHRTVDILLITTEYMYAADVSLFLCFLRAH